MMEKGSFHSSRPSTLNTSSSSSSAVLEADERVRKIPLPNQLPKGMDFSDIPVTAFKSSTLETLISQNEDLMARLSVALRKNSEMEEKITHFERESQSVRTRFETFKEQYLVLQEKDRLASQRTAGLHEDNVNLKVQVSKLEKMYSDVFIQAQAFQRRLIHLETYRARVKKASQGLRTQLKEVKYLRAQVQEGREAQARLVHSYDSKLTEARAQVEILREKAAERDRLYNSQIEIENKLVWEQRQAVSYREDAENRLTQAAQEASSLRVQLKEALIDRESTHQDAQNLRLEVPNLRLSNANLTEQVESLQALWNHKQRELEHALEKNKSLQKLNQSISLNLNQQRKEIHTLGQELENERFTSQEKIKALNQEIALVREQARSAADTET